MKNDNPIKFYFDRKRIVLAIIVLVAFAGISVWFIKEPEKFIRNVFMKKFHVQLLGYLSFTSTLIMTSAYLVLLFRRKTALIIADNYLIDNTKFDSVGRIDFDEIISVQKLNKYNVEIGLKESVLESKKMNVLQKIIYLLTNWYWQRYSIRITCVHIRDCNRDKLYRLLKTAISQSKKPPETNR